MRTFSSPNTASKPSISTSSSSSSTWLSGRGPLGRTLVESWSSGLGPVVGLGLIVSRDEAEPGRRIPCRGAGTAGLTGKGLGGGSWEAGGSGLGAALGVGLGAGGVCPAALVAGRDEAARGRGA